jgi:4-hydroxybenzoate polyprenyltransferase
MRRRSYEIPFWFIHRVSSALPATGPRVPTSSLQIIAFVCVALAPIQWLRRSAPATLTLLAHDLRLERLLHYDAMLVLGAVLYWRTAPGLPSWPALLALVGMLAALVYAAVFAIVSNNIEDLPIDRISNVDRPLVRNAIEPAAYRKLGVASLLIALALSALIGLPALLGVAAVSLLYFLYSCTPFRLKRIPVFAKLMIGANSAILALVGFVLAGGSWQALPLPWALYLLLAVGMAANFVDLKDAEGDAAEGIETLPVLFGIRRARQLIVTATVVAYATAAWLLGSWLLLPVNIALLTWHIVELRRTPFVEQRVFRVYLLSQVALIGALCLSSRYPIP